MDWEGSHFSPENVGRLFSHYYISGKLEHIYPEKQQDNSDKDNGSKHMEGMVQEVGMLDKHSHLLNNISDKLYNTVTGNSLESNSMLQMQVIGVRIKGQFISNFTVGFYQIIWNPVKSLEVKLTVGQAWQMELVLIYQYKPCATNHLLVNMDALAMVQNQHWYTD